MAAYRRVYDSRHLQAGCQEPGSYIRSAIEYGLPLPFYITGSQRPHSYCPLAINVEYVDRADTSVHAKVCPQSYPFPWEIWTSHVVPWAYQSPQLNGRQSRHPHFDRFIRFVSLAVVSNRQTHTP